MDMVENMAFAESGGFPWHGKGNPVGDDLSTDEMLVASGANFLVKKTPEFITLAGKRVPTGRFALTRNDREDASAILGHVTKLWKPLQNKEAFNFFHEFVEAGKMTMDTAGVLDDGRICWVLAKTNKKFAIRIGGQEDEIDPYIFFANPHIYGRSITIIGTAVRVVCWNTFQLALAKGSDMTYRLDHRTKFDPEIAKKTLGITAARMDEFKTAAEFLASKKASNDDTKEFFDQIFPLTKKAKDSDRELSRNTELILNEVLAEQPGAHLGEGTWWHNFNTVTFMTDHLIGNNENTRMKSAFYGDGRDKKEQAMRLALEYAKKAA